MKTRIALAFGLLLAATGAWAQDTRPIQMIVPYPPGGNTDLMARALQAELTQALGQTVVVVNRGGAAGTIGDAAIARATPDGSTIGMSPNNPLTAQPHLQSLSYSLDSFRFLCLVYDNPQVLVAGRGAPFRDFAGMIAHARSGKEALVYGSPGQGSTQHILMAALLKAAGVDGLHVPFTGAGPMATAALGGQIQVFVESPSIPTNTGLPMLAVFGRERMEALPQVPTVAELGHPIEGSSAGGLVGPAGMPEAAAAAIERACATAVASPGFRQAAERLNAVPRYLPGTAFRDRFAAESEMNRTVLKELGLAQ
ncbi:tripartite tricarboxylate transporter substrate binding protein [Falsiroseomonas tokyonensis]|uniref:Tripartite tricarboxylate transporter substrate binding protein n=1 Tax=Falsiroseomonas tokyonensis TaxID=430521 RepID=A0ABV7C3K6_9PROT|nr:tripartite tricarboxylate transporter substrate binding protein [Falsiroseomonas tokyonensis]MBU8541001.1 tripartite tricarboxylate transporter substrate binding protein [Falsiroseomonas tokyonensis]